MADVRYSQAHFSFVSFVFFVVLTPIAPSAGAQAIRVGGEFQVNTYTAVYGYQKLPAAAMAANGDFVVVWTSSQDGSDYGIFGQRFSSAGAALGSEFQINVYTTGFQFTPAVAMEADGDFVVAWESSGQDSDLEGIVARPFSSAGDALSSDVAVNTYANSFQRFPSVGVIAGGDFVVAWQSYTQDGSGNGVFAQRFSSVGVALGGEFQVSEHSMNDQQNAAVAGAPDGGFLVAWTDFGLDGSQGGLFARRFSSTGGALASEFQVNSYTPGMQNYAEVAFAADGEFVVAWQSYGQDGSEQGILARRFAGSGAPVTPEFLVNAHHTSFQRFPDVAVHGNGDFVVTWQSLEQDSSGDGVFARRFSRSGGALAGEFQVHSYTTGLQGYATVAGGAGGSFVVAWSRAPRDDYELVVIAQRFMAPKLIDVDGDGAVLPLTDGLLVIRSAFGFTGEVLTSGAVNTNGCTRCDAASIQAYLQTLN